MEALEEEILNSDVAGIEVVIDKNGRICLKYPTGKIICPFGAGAGGGQGSNKKRGFKVYERPTMEIGTISNLG